MKRTDVHEACTDDLLREQCFLLALSGGALKTGKTPVANEQNNTHTHTNKTNQILDPRAYFISLTVFWQELVLEK